MNRLIKKMVPAVVKRKMLQAMRNYWTKREAHIPNYSLEEQHICHLKPLVNRQAMLSLLPQNGVVAELGVALGIFSEQILAINQPKKLHLVDVWSSDAYNEEFMKAVEEKFKSEIGQGRVEINRGLSAGVVDQYSSFVSGTTGE